MGYEVTGFARSLTIRIYKMAYGSVVSGYPKIYDGKTNIDFLAYYSPLYSSISDDEMAKMSLVDFNARLNDFKAWLETVEYELDFDTALIFADEDARIASDDCTTSTTSTSTSTSTTSTTTIAPTTTTTTTPPPTTTTTSTSSTTTTSTTSEPTTTTTSTTIIYCESPLCETALTVGTDGTGNYGFLRGLVGSISPDCGSVNVVGYMDSQGLLGVVLIDYVCDVTLWINGVEYELTYSGYVPEYGGNVYIIPLILNPLPSVGETCNVAICGTECTTTTTTTCDPSKCDYGLLYNWYAVDTAKLAPTGWHVPSDSEWTTLTTWFTNNGYGYEGSGDDIAKSMASQCNWNPSSDSGTPGNNPASNNSSGFSGLPGGSRSYPGGFDYVGSNGLWWSSTEYSAYGAWLRGLDYNYPDVGRNYDAEGLGFSVRCVRDTYEGWENDVPVVDYDGNEYDVVEIGTQLWLVQNLKVTHYNDGESIPNVTDDTTWGNLTTGALCAYNNDWETYACVDKPTTTTTTTIEPTTTTTTEEPTTTTTTTTAIESYDFCVEYGALYNWYAATDVRNIAPEGWHVPTKTEFETLYSNVPGSTEIDKAKAVSDSEYWTSGGGNNLTGFNARGSGQRGDNVDLGRFVSIGTHCNILSATEYEADKCYYVALASNTQFATNTRYYKSRGYSLRLIKDDSINTGTMVGNDGKVYPTVTIGTQVWMAANLAETKYRNGDLISNHGETYTDKYTDAEWSALTTEAMCYYDNDISYAGEMGECPTTTTTTTTTSP